MERFNEPVFCGGYFKSGTSLLRAMISRHPEISGGLETYWYELDLVKGRARNDESIELYLKRMSVFFDLPETQLQEIVKSATRGEELLDSMMTHYAHSQGKSRWIEKTPGNILNIPRIYSYWPKARFIHIIRNPLDIYVSILNTRKNMTPEIFVMEWVNWISKARMDIEQIQDSERFYKEVGYEQLVLETEITLRSIVEFLDEKWVEDLENFTGQPDDFEKVKIATGKNSPTLARLSKPITNERVNVWHSLEREIIDQLLENADKSGYGMQFRNACGNLE